MEFEAITRQYSAMLFRHIYRMVGNHEDAQDILQEVLLQIYRKLHTYRGDASLKTWIFRIASNRTIDFLRQAKRRKTEELPETLQSSDSPLAFAQRSIRRDQLWEALAQLPTDQRQLVVFKEINGLTFREIAGILDIPENTAKTRMYASLRKLRTYLEETGHVFSHTHKEDL